MKRWKNWNKGNNRDKSAAVTSKENEEMQELEEGEIHEENKTYKPPVIKDDTNNEDAKGKKRARERSPILMKRRRLESEKLYSEQLEYLSDEEDENLVDRFVRLVDPKPENHIPIEAPWRRAPRKLPNTPLLHVSDNTISKGLGYGLIVAGIAFSALDFYGNVFGG